jgi:hypothetical protein
MNRTLKRPMFRMGGSTGTGITSGLDKPRKQFSEGTNNPLLQYPTDYFPPLGVRKQETNAPSITTDKPSMSAGEQLLKAFADRDTKPDLSQFLINFGLNLASATPRGNIISTAAEAAKSPTDTLFKQIGAEKAFDRELNLAATKMDINQRLKQEAEERQNQKAIEAAQLKFERDLKLGNIEFERKLLLQKPETTAAIRNALAMDLVPGTKEFNDYVIAATIKGAGLQIKFKDDGTIDSITEGPVPKDKNKLSKAMELKNATFAMNNVATTLLQNLQGAKVSTVGGFINALDSVGSQLSQLADATGFRTGGYKDEGTGAIDDYLRKNLGDGVFADAVQYGKIRSNAINLAYLMARVDEPGGRFTDRDIALKMEEIGIGANPQKTAAILADAINIRNKNAAFAYKQLTDGEELNFEGFNLIDERNKENEKIQQGAPEYILRDGKVFQIINGKEVEVNM